MPNKKRIDIAKTAALKAGKLLTHFHKNLKIKFKTSKDIVTKADVMCQKEILKLIRKHFPEDGIFSEEGINERHKDKGMWFIDPLDGTVNYSRHMPIFGVSIAYVEKDDIKVGVIYLPHFKELYHAELGKGAYCNNKRIHVSKTTSTQKAIINLMDFNMGTKNNIKRLNYEKLRLATKLIDNSMRLKIFSSAAVEMAYTAYGKIDAHITVHSNFYDIAAGTLLVREAGGIATDFKGNKSTEKSQTFIACNKILNKKYQKLLKNFK